jgi:tRNA-intron endonuclease
LHIEAKGRLQNDLVIIEDTKQASRIYNRGYHGEPLPGGGLKLQLIEAVYLVETDRLEVFNKKQNMNVPSMIEYSTKQLPSFEIQYIVYRDFRQRGYVVKPAKPSFDFRIFDRGGVPRKTLAKYWVNAVSERAKFDIGKMKEQLSSAINLRKKLIYGIVDEEGDLTYYDISELSPKGRKRKGAALKDGIKVKGTSVLLEDRVMIWDPRLASRLHQSEFYGKMVGPGLQISLVETAYLKNKKILVIKDAKTGRKVSLTRFKNLASDLQPEFDLRLTAYKDLKKRGLIVKTGFKYGTHFRVYEGDPDSDHSEYLMHAVPKKYITSWEEISRAVRLAHGVRKDMVFVRILGLKRSNIDYIRIARIRP